jgi:hypothetical protein
MDRSFLSRAEVVAASRAYVCARLATYEDKEEGEFLKGLMRTRSGELENSVFAILAPDGKTKLTRAGRSPRHSYRGAEEMAEDLQRIAARSTPRQELSALPTVASVRLAMDVAAADNQPLALVVAPAGPEREALVRKVAALAWSKELVGRFVYAVASGAKDLAEVSGVKEGAAVVVVEPNRFGLKGKALAQAAAGGELAAALRAGLRAFARRPAEHFNHVRDGRREGVFWETPFPVTDPEEARARGRR